MKGLKRIFLTTLFLGVMFGVLLNAQTTYSKVKVVLKKPGQIKVDWGYGDFIQMLNLDSDDEKWFAPKFNYKRIYFDSIPNGTYLVRICSEFGHCFYKTVEITHNTTVTFQLTKFYSSRKDTISPLNVMKNNDTINIVADTRSCFSFSWASARIIKQNDIFYMDDLRDSLDILEIMNEDQLDFFRKLETGTGKIYSTTTSEIRMEYKRKVKCFLKDGGSGLPYHSKRY